MTFVLSTDEEPLPLQVSKIKIERDRYSNWLEFSSIYRGKLTPIAEYNLVTHEIEYKEGRCRDGLIESICKLVTAGM